MDPVRAGPPATGVLCWLLAWTSVLSADDSANQFFEEKIGPVLAEHCYECHSAQAKRAIRLKGGLLLDSRDGVRRGGDSGPAVIPGNPEDSLILEALRFESLEMPPAGKLPDEVIGDFVRWIEMGAPDPRDVDAAIGSGELSEEMLQSLEYWAFEQPADSRPPTVRNSAWPRGAVDQFVLAKLEAAGLQPSPMADRRTLIRRATYDLTGLPPTGTEIASFLSDESPDAYPRLIERLLSSPHYGERWGRHWLDVARYADTKGYVYSDREEPRFVHSSTYRDWVISALNQDLPYDAFLLYQIAGDQVLDSDGRRPLAAMGLLTLGQRFANVRQEVINDRIDTVTRATLGLTVACARCHDHPADPIPTADYYSLYGVLAGSSERMLPVTPPVDQSGANGEWLKEMRKRERAYADHFDKVTGELLETLRSLTPAYLAAVLNAAKLPPDEFYQVFDKDDVRPFLVRRWERYIHEQRILDRVHPIFGVWHACAEMPKSELETRFPAWLREHGEQLNPHVAAAFEAAPPTSMEEVAGRYGDVFATVHELWKQAQQNQDTRLSDEAAEQIRQVLYGPDSPIAAPVGAFSEIEWFYDERVRVSLGQKWREIERWVIESEDAPAYAVIMEDHPVQRDARILNRGNVSKPGAVVPRRTLLAVSGDDRRPFQQGSGRLELARSIANPENPLTARVLVNRVWLHHFGEGIVSTPSNFGWQGDRPSHPELLDWLAVRFVEDGWSIKRLHRRIMLSSTYRQSSRDNADGREKDPDNRLLWRMSPRRLDFEQLRDSILAAAGTLDDAMGGKPVDLVADSGSTRRTVYGIVDRLQLPGVYRVFDFANPDEHAPRRQPTTVPQQALYFMNSRFVATQAAALAARLDASDVSSAEQRVAALYLHVYGREPSEEDLQRGLEFVTSPTDWERYAHALLMTNEFLFLD